uniref:Uncharacterized protein n=1 Tax=Rhizophora mucronata TaxID=61149 RepID=A0A2P2QVH9_RHIMU
MLGISIYCHNLFLAIYCCLRLTNAKHW